MDFFTIFPLWGILIYLIPIVCIAWFLISFLRIQRERNELLKEIARKLK